MSVASRIIDALHTVAPTWPVQQDVMDSNEDCYFVIRMDARPADYADDAPEIDVWDVAVHLFAPFTVDTTILRRQVRRALFDVTDDYPDMVNASEAIRSSDGTEQHIVFECEYLTGVGENDV